MTLECLGQLNATVMYINLETCVRLIRALYPPHASGAPTDPSMILANPVSNARILHSTREVAYYWETGETASVRAWSVVLPSGALGEMAWHAAHARKLALAMAIAYPNCRAWTPRGHSEDIFSFEERCYINTGKKQINIWE